MSFVPVGDIYQDGWDCGLTGGSVEDCPYSKGDHRRESWIAGLVEHLCRDCDNHVTDGAEYCEECFDKC